MAPTQTNKLAVINPLEMETVSSFGQQSFFVLNSSVCHLSLNLTTTKKSPKSMI